MKYIVGILTFILFFGFISAEAFSAQSNLVGIWEVEENQKITPSDLKEVLEEVEQVVVGETHNTPAVQQAEADLLSLWAEGSREHEFTFAWEFLNWSDRYLIHEAYSRFSDDQMDAAGFLEMTFGSADSVKEYIPLLNRVKNLGGTVLPTNLSRAEKAPVTEGGLAALDPKLLPKGFELGGKNYFERFEKAMGGHTTPEKLKNYFAAQSLVDDVVAFHVTEHAPKKNVFLVIGSFHTEYFDGVMARLDARDLLTARASVRIVPVSKFESEESFQAYLQDAKYGSVADFVIVTE